MFRITALRQFILALFVFLFGMASQANISFKGTVTVEGTDVFVEDENSSQKLALYSADADIKKHFNRLQTGDYITGTATEIKKPRIMVDGIDFVGLKRVLGTWYNDKTVFKFKDFSLLAVWKLKSKGSLFVNKNYTYSITPGELAQWQIFFADSDGVFLASLDFAQDIMFVTTYDPVTGEKAEVIRLRRF